METKTKDQMVDELSYLVEQKQSEIDTIEKPVWNTTCSFKYTDESTPINLHTVKDTIKLTNILAYIIGKDRDFAEAANVIGIDVKFKHQGYLLSEWLSDIKTEIGKITITNKREKLDILKRKLELLESPQQREAKELAKIQEELSNL